MNPTPTSQRFLPRASMLAPLLLAGFLLSDTAGAQGSQSARFNPIEAGRMLVGSADTDGDGSVSAAEWSAFVASATRPDTDQMLARSLTGYYDSDGDGVLGAPDLAALLARWDSDNSGDISAQERGSGPGAFFLLDGVILNALDADQNQAVSAEEWAACANIDLVRWLAAAAAIQEDANGFGPGTMVLTLRASLDADRNGTFDGADIQKLFTDLDKNGDGNVDAGELAPAPRRTGGGWTLTQEERSRPPAMPWQRSLEDALVLSKETGKPLLICVNMDGEAASENLAGGRYADPEFIQLVEGFIPVLASPNMHVEQTTGPRGQRIECPRFGRLVCNEHIDAEPELYRRFFSEMRRAPRHVGVAPDGTILFDLMLLQDLSIVDDYLRQHGNFETALANPAEASDQDLLGSPDAAARAELRDRFLAGSPELRLSLAGRAFSSERSVQHPELLKLALYDSSAPVRSVAAAQMIEGLSPEFVNLVPRLQWIVGDDGDLRQKLVAKLNGLTQAAADEDLKKRPRRLARVIAARGLSSSIDAKLWRLALAGAPAAISGARPSAGEELEASIETLSALLADDPSNADLNGLMAQTALRMALRAIRGEAGGNPQFLLQDAEASAFRALAVRPQDIRARATQAQAKWWLSKPSEAADIAASVLPDLFGVSEAPLTADLLDILSKGRGQALAALLGSAEGWPGHWLAEAMDAHLILAAHPSSTVEQALAGISFAESMEDYRAQELLVRAALARFPASNDLHAWLRWQILRDGSDELSPAAALERAYNRMRTPAGSEATWLWYKGLGLQVAADTYVSQGQIEQAAEAYLASISNLEESIAWNADFEASAGELITKSRTALEGL